jgi:translation initiation factor 2 alpha subunit (eIF-2alpha)
VELSKKTVTSDEKETKEKEWSKTKMIDSMLESVSRKLEYPKEKIYEESIWPLYHKFEDTNIYTIFEKMIIDPTLFCSDNEKLRTVMLKLITEKLITKKQKYQVDINLTCFYNEDGIEMIKKALSIAVDKGFDTKYFAAPIYIISNKYIDEESASSELLSVCDEIKEFISQNGGQMEIDKKPRILSE